MCSSSKVDRQGLEKGALLKNTYQFMLGFSGPLGYFLRLKVYPLHFNCSACVNTEKFSIRKKPQLNVWLKLSLLTQTNTNRNFCGRHKYLLIISVQIIYNFMELQ